MRLGSLGRGYPRGGPTPLVVTLLTAAVAAMAGLLGLAIGSFLNVVIWRVPRGESLVRPPSHCPACDAPVRSRDNVPVLSWLLLRWRCRDCHARISVRYLSLIHISEPTRLLSISYAVFCLPTRLLR